jgi:DNA invertase Pin-like site-specific DNA recombinase
MRESIEPARPAPTTHAARQGWRVVAEFTDAAISGASMANRPGLQDLMRAARYRA